MESSDEQPIGGRGRVIKFKQRSPFGAGATTSIKTVRRCSRGHHSSRTKRDTINKDISARRRASRARLANRAGDSSDIKHGASRGWTGVVGVIEDRGVHVALIACANGYGDRGTEGHGGLDHHAICAAVCRTAGGVDEAVDAIHDWRIDDGAICHAGDAIADHDRLDGSGLRNRIELAVGAADVHIKRDGVEDGGGECSAANCYGASDAPGCIQTRRWIRTRTSDRGTEDILDPV